MWFNRLRALSLLLAFGTAIIPFVTYITDENRDLLWLLIAANIFAYIMVALSTIRITLDVVGREKAKVYVPPRYADNPVMSKWYTAVRLTWKWHALAAVARMGLVLALLQFLHAEVSLYGYWSIYFPLVYTSEAIGLFAPGLHPQWETTLVSIIVTILFVMAEARLLSSLVLMAKSFSSKVRRTIIKAVSCRILLIVLSICIAGMLMNATEKLRPAGILVIAWNSCLIEHQNDYNWSDNHFERCVLETEQNPDYLRSQATMRIIETMHLTGLTLIDNSTTLVANIMRPVGKESAFACVEHIYSKALNQYTCSIYDNRPFVARNIVAGLLGLLLYAGLTHLMLRLAMQQYRHEIASTA